jgi:RNA polymerase sigma-70 factor (ECF subfamily)
VNRFTNRSNTTTTEQPLDAALQLARTGDPLGFNQLFHAHADAIRGFGRLRGAPEPDELANTVLFDAFRALPTFDGNASAFRSFIFRIARNKIVDGRRAAASRPQPAGTHVTDQHMPPLDGADADTLHALGIGHLADAFTALTDEQRELIVLRFVVDLSLQETAATLGKPLTAVKAMQRRALATLRRTLSTEVVSQ